MTGNDLTARVRALPRFRSGIRDPRNDKIVDVDRDPGYVELAAVLALIEADAPAASEHADCGAYCDCYFRGKEAERLTER